MFGVRPTAFSICRIRNWHSRQASQRRYLIAYKTARAHATYKSQYRLQTGPPVPTACGPPHIADLFQQPDGGLHVKHRNILRRNVTAIPGFVLAASEIAASLHAMTFAARVGEAAEEAYHKCHFVLHFSTLVEETAVHRGIRNHAELRQASLRSPRIEESARDNGQNGTLQWIRSKAVGHAHKPRRKLSPGRGGRTSSATHRIPPPKRQAATDQCRRRGTNGDGLRGIAWYHQIPADLRCAVMPIRYQAAYGREDLAAPGERSTMNTLHRILAYLFRGKPTGPLVIGWSYQNGQRAVFRLPH